MEKQAHRARRYRQPEPERMQLTRRDQQVVQWIYTAGFATREQLQRLFFSEGGRARCQARLTLLYRNRYIDKLPNTPVNAPDVYLLSRRSTIGLQLLQALNPDATVTPQKSRHPLLSHTLDVLSCKIAVTKACESTGYTLSLWLDEAECAQAIHLSGLLPDAYFQIVRFVNDTPRRSGYFLEVERSTKSQRELTTKINRYWNFYDTGQYAQSSAFGGTKALRVLYLIGADYGINPERYIKNLVSLSKERSADLLWFAPLETFLAQSPKEILAANIWRTPTTDQPCALYESELSH